MTVDDIRALIALGESRTLELKKTTGELKDGMHAACAFLYSRAMRCRRFKIFPCKLHYPGIGSRCY